MTTEIFPISWGGLDKGFYGNPSKQKSQVESKNNEMKAEKPQIVQKFNFDKITRNHVIDSHDDTQETDDKLQLKEIKENPTEMNIDSQSQSKMPTLDPMTNSEIEKRVTETLIRLLKQLPQESLGNIQNQHLSKILINEHDERSNSGVRDLVNEQRVDYSSNEDWIKFRNQTFSHHDNLESYPGSQERDSVSRKVNFEPKNVVFPNQPRKSKKKRKVLKRVIRNLEENHLKY